MARPPAKELTGRELQIMHCYWRHGSATAQEIRDRLAEADGLDLTYTTVATLVRILVDKGFLQAINNERPFRYQATRPYEEVSGKLLDDVVDRVFLGSRKALLLRLFGDQRLSAKEKAALEKIMEGLES
ncbi:MAG TPA: BlaI/MecI/CopY family transcriptional regulator [Gemmatales bacterium]|nr:BlaI/MecI/CopY family transcriptional regulator [Gemmatales bacterium]HMP58784.1 BlaI/MecI/CopY family transcriptional regulator [Gemmatales bacterium]